MMKYIFIAHAELGRQVYHTDHTDNLTEYVQTIGGITDLIPVYNS